MASKPNQIKVLAKQNPKVDLEKVRRVVGTLEEVRSLGFAPRSEQILLPYDRTASLASLKHQGQS